MNKGSKRGLSRFLKWALLPALIFLAFRLGGNPEWTNGSPMDFLKSISERLMGQKTKPAPPPSAKTELDYYTIMMGSYRSEADAKTRRMELMNDRIHSSMMFMDGKYLVVVGKFPTQKQAKKTLEAVQKKGYDLAQIIGG